MTFSEMYRLAAYRQTHRTREVLPAARFAYARTHGHVWLFRLHPDTGEAKVTGFTYPEAHRPASNEEPAEFIEYPYKYGDDDRMHARIRMNAWPFNTLEPNREYTVVA